MMLEIIQKNRHGIPLIPERRRVEVRQCHKQRHATREIAFDHLVAFEAITGDFTMTVYKCRWCRDKDGNYGWHIGHRERDQIAEFFKQGKRR